VAYCKVLSEHSPDEMKENNDRLKPLSGQSVSSHRFEPDIYRIIASCYSNLLNNMCEIE
jgi:hypothetical protein